MQLRPVSLLWLCALTKNFFFYIVLNIDVSSIVYRAADVESMEIGPRMPGICSGTPSSKSRYSVQRLPCVCEHACWNEILMKATE